MIYRNSDLIITMIKVLSQLIFLTVVCSIVGLGFWLAYKPWYKLSKAFETELSPSKIFFEQQSCILGETRIKGYFNIGITKQKLYLSHTSPLSYFIHSLLIDIDAIVKIESCHEPLLNRSYKLFIGNPNITTLILSKYLLEKLESDYGEPIFSNKLE